MPRRADIASILIIGAALICATAACGAPRQGVLRQPPGARAAADEFPAVARNCGLPEAVLAQFTGSALRGALLLPPELYARRGEQPVAGRIACIDHWAHERGLRLFASEARR